MEIIVSEAVEEKAKEKQKESGGTVLMKSTKPPIHTRKQVAEVAGVSEDTVRKVEIIEKEGTEDPLE